MLDRKRKTVYGERAFSQFSVNCLSFTVYYMPVTVVLARLLNHRRSCFFIANKYSSGIIINVSRVELISPPTMGAAIRCITSEPVPVPKSAGKSASMVVLTVIATWIVPGGEYDRVEKEGRTIPVVRSPLYRKQEL